MARTHARGVHRATPAWPSNATKRKLFALSAIALLILVIGAIAVWHHDGSLNVELSLTRWLVGPVPDPPSLSLRELRSFPLYLLILPGEPVPFIAIVGVLVWLAWQRDDKRLALLCLLGPPLAVLLTDLIAKPLIHRTLREGLAYPSGHTTAATALAFAAFVLLRRLYGAKAARYGLPLLIVAPLLTGFGLLALHWHVLLDIPGGLAMGVAVMSALSLAILDSSASDQSS